MYKSITCLFFFIFSSLCVFSQTTINSDITSNTTWTTNNSPFTVTSDIDIQSSATLTIEPGVIVKFKKNKSLTISGNLVAKGTASKPIVFTADTASPSHGHWKGFLFRGSAYSSFNSNLSYQSGSIFEYAHISYAGGSQDAAVVTSSSYLPYFNYSSITYSSSAAIYANDISDTFIIQNSLFAFNSCSNTQASDQAAVHIRSNSNYSKIYFISNIVKQNSGSGANIYSNSFNSNYQPDILKNIFYQNELHGLIATNAKVQFNSFLNNNPNSNNGKYALNYWAFSNIGSVNHNLFAWNKGSEGAALKFRSSNDSLFNNKFVENIATDNIILLEQIEANKIQLNSFSKNSAPVILKINSPNVTNSSLNLSYNTFEQNSANQAVINTTTNWFNSSNTGTINAQYLNFYQNNSPYIVKHECNYGIDFNANNSFFEHKDSNCLYANTLDYYDNRNYGKISFNSFSKSPVTSAPILSPIRVKKQSISSGVRLSWNKTLHSPSTVKYAILYGNRKFNGFFGSAAANGNDSFIDVSGVSLSDTFVVASYLGNLTLDSSVFFKPAFSWYSMASTNPSILTVDTTCKQFQNPDITTNTTWTIANSPYVINQDLNVTSGVTLTIEPGVIVKFKKNKSLTISGNLVAKGTASKPIVFTADTASPSHGHWKGFLFRGSAYSSFNSNLSYQSGSIFEYAHISYAGGSQDAAVVTSSSYLPYFNYSSITYSSSAAIYANDISDTFIIQNSLFAFNSCSNTQASDQAAVHIRSNSNYSKIYFISNIVKQNSGSGANIYSNSFNSNYQPDILKNIFYQNELHGLIATNAKVQFNSFLNNNPNSNNGKYALNYWAFSNIGSVNHNLFAWNKGSEGAALKFRSSNDSLFNNKFVENIATDNIILLEQIEANKIQLNSFSKNSAPVILKINSPNVTNSSLNLSYNTFEQNSANQAVINTTTNWFNSSNTGTINAQYLNFYQNNSPYIIKHECNYGINFNADSSTALNSNYSSNMDSFVYDYQKDKNLGSISIASSKSKQNILHKKLSVKNAVIINKSNFNHVDWKDPNASGGLYYNLFNFDTDKKLSWITSVANNKFINIADSFYTKDLFVGISTTSTNNYYDFLKSNSSSITKIEKCSTCALNFQWIGNQSYATKLSNWDRGFIPGEIDTLSMVNGILSVDSSFSVSYLSINSTGLIKLDKNFQVKDIQISNGTIDLNGHRLTITGSIYQSTDSSNYYIQAGTAASPKPNSELVFAPTANTSSTIYFNPNANKLKVLELGTSSKTAQVTLGNSVNIKGGKTPFNVGSLKINKGSKIIIPNGASLTLQSDTFNAYLNLAAPAQRAIHCSGTGTFNIERQHYGARGWRLYSHPFNANLDLQQVADDIELIGSGGTSEGFYSDAHTNNAAFWYDYSKADTTATTDLAWTGFNSAKGSVISGNANKWKKHSPIIMFNPGTVRGSGAFSNPALATYQEGKITLSYVLDSTSVHLNDGKTQTISTADLISAPKSRYFFLTNPFTAPVRLGRVQGLNLTNCANKFYYWKQNHASISSNFMPAAWASEALFNGNATRDSNISIPAFGTILIEMKDPSVATTFTIPESAKQLSNFSYIVGGDLSNSGSGVKQTTFLEIPQTFQGPGAIEVQLLMNDSVPVDRMLIYDRTGESASFTNNDAKKFKEPSFSNIYSLSRSGESLSLDAQDITARLNSGEEQVEIPLVIDRDFNKTQKNLRLRIWEKHTDLQCYFKDSKSGNLTPAESFSDIPVEFSESDASIHSYSLIFKRSSTSTEDFKEVDLARGSKVKPEIIVYPNPANDLLHLRVLNGSDKLSYQIYSITGVKVLEGSLDNSQKININTLQPGIYIMDAGGQKVKFVKE